MNRENISLKDISNLVKVLCFVNFIMLLVSIRMNWLYYITNF